MLDVVPDFLVACDLDIWSTYFVEATGKNRVTEPHLKILSTRHVTAPGEGSLVPRCFNCLGESTSGHRTWRIDVDLLKDERVTYK